MLLHILLILLFGETTGLTQLAKLPKLFEHLQEHAAANPEVGLLKFLSMHYWGHDMDDNDDDKDRQLPFKTYDSGTPVFLVTLENKKIVLKPQTRLIVKDFNLYQPAYYLNPAGASLFRPPKA